MPSVLKLTPDLTRGSIAVVGSGVPDGDVLITRDTRRAPEEIRSGTFHSDTGGFIRTDVEASFGTELTYRVTDTVDERHIQTNRVLNPKAAVDTTGWTTGTGRTLAREASAPMVPPRYAATSLKIAANPGGVTYATLKDRLLASHAPSGFGTGRWFFSGQMYYDSPDLWLWEDVEDAGTWQAVKTLGTWQQIRSKSSEAAAQPFATLWAAVVAPTDTTTEQRRNRVPNPSPASTTGYTVNAGTGGTAALTYVSTGGPTGGGFTRATWSVASTATGTGSIRADGRAAAALPIPVTPGEVLAATTRVRSSIAQRLQGAIWFFDAAGVQTGYFGGTTSVVAINTWTTLTVPGVTVPAGSAYAMVGAAAVAGTGAVVQPVGSTLDIALGQLQATAVGGVPGTFFSGATAAVGPMTYTWAGTANASASIESKTDLTVVVAPFQVLGVEAIGGNQWHTFQAWVDVPAGAPAGSRLVFLQGPLTREYAVSWWLTSVMVTPEVEVLPGGAVPFFDGDSALPVNPANNLVPGYDWTDLSGDASMTWDGTPNNSPSTFTGPSIIQASSKLTFGVPDRKIAPSEPVMLTDPVAPQLTLWFTLLGIGDLTYPGRGTEYDVIGRRDRVNVGQVRGLETGQIQLMTRTLDEASIAERIFAPGRVLLLRNPNPAYPENGWYLSFPAEVVASRLGRDQRRPERIWTGTFTRVRRPSGLIEASSSVTWSNVRDARTWADLRQGDWLEAATVPPGAA